MWDHYCVKCLPRTQNVKVTLSGPVWKMTQGQPNTHTHRQMGPRHSVLLPYPLISLETSPRQITSCSAISAPKQHHCLSGATDSQYHTHKHTVRLCPPGIGFYPECHIRCLDMISVGNRKPSTFFSHDSHVAWLLSSQL